MNLYAIFDVELKDFVKELPSKVDDGGEAILVYRSRRAAESRAVKHFACEGQRKAVRDSIYNVLWLNVGHARVAK